MNNKDNFDKDKENLQGMLDLAEFGAKRHDDRRSIEFRIFISYMTLLILAFYQIIKATSISVELWQSIGLTLLSIGIHIAYVMWQIGVAIAMANDAWRRNFYLKKAECILHHLSKYPENTFCPSNAEVKVNFGSEKREMTEKQLFKEPAPIFISVSNFGELFKHFNQIWNDWSRMFVIAVPTLLLLILAALFFKKAY